MHASQSIGFVDADFQDLESHIACGRLGALPTLTHIGDREPAYDHKAIAIALVVKMPRDGTGGRAVIDGNQIKTGLVGNAVGEHCGYGEACRQTFGESAVAGDNDQSSRPP